MPCSCSRLAAYASPSRTSPSHSTHRRHTCRVGRWARRMCCGPAAGGSAGCVRRRRQRVRRSVSPRPTRSKCCSGLAAPPHGPLLRRRLCSSRPAARACAPCATRASRLSPRFSAQPLAHALRRAAAAIAGVETTVAAAPDGDYIASAALPQTLAAAFDALTSVLQTDKASTALLAKELTDALILQRGDPAQVLTVISSRLHYIANRCDAFIAPPLHPVRIPARIHCTHSLHAFPHAFPHAFIAPPLHPVAHLLHRRAFTAPVHLLHRRCIYCTAVAFTASVHLLHHRCIYCTVHLLHRAFTAPCAAVALR